MDSPPSGWKAGIRFAERGCLASARLYHDPDIKIASAFPAGVQRKAVTQMIRFDRYPGGRRCALTLSYDDAVRQDIRFIGLLDKYGLKSTFHINSGLLDSDRKVPLGDLARVYEGHEIAAHGVKHEFLSRIPYQSVIAEVYGDKKRLEDACGRIVRGMSYAYGDYTETVMAALRACGIDYARTTRPVGNLLFPENFLAWHPTCHHNQALPVAESFMQRKTGGALLYVWGHSYEFDNGDGWDRIEAFCKTVSGDSDIWYATNAEVFDYITALRALKLSADNKTVYNPSALTVWFTDGGREYSVGGGETLRIGQ